MFSELVTSHSYFYLYQDYNSCENKVLSFYGMANITNQNRKKRFKWQNFANTFEVPLLHYMSRQWIAVFTGISQASSVWLLRGGQPYNPCGFVTDLGPCQGPDPLSVTPIQKSIKNRLLVSKTANSQKTGKNLYIDKILYTIYQGAGKRPQPIFPPVSTI